MCHIQSPGATSCTNGCVVAPAGGSAGDGCASGVVVEVDGESAVSVAVRIGQPSSSLAASVGSAGAVATGGESR